MDTSHRNMLPTRIWEIIWEEGAEAARVFILTAPATYQPSLNRDPPANPYRTDQRRARAWAEGFRETMQNHRSGAPTGL